MWQPSQLQMCFLSVAESEKDEGDGKVLLAPFESEKQENN